MSVELRVNENSFEFECDWGVIENGDPDSHPYTREPKHLCLITPDYVETLALTPVHSNGATSSVTTDDQGRRFVHLLRDDGREWIWQLHEANWDDGEGDRVFIGRWPD